MTLIFFFYLTESQNWLLRSLMFLSYIHLGCAKMISGIHLCNEGFSSEPPQMTMNSQTSGITLLSAVWKTLLPLFLWLCWW